MNDVLVYPLALMCVCRFHTCRQKEVKARGEVESSDSKHRHNRKTKPSTTKSSVLKSIYGKATAV